MTHKIVSSAPNLARRREPVRHSPLIDSLSTYYTYFTHHSTIYNMPSDLSYWIISAPLKDGDPGLMLSDVRNALGDSVEVGQWELPELKVCHLGSPIDAYPSAMVLG